MFAFRNNCEVEIFTEPNQLQERPPLWKRLDKKARGRNLKKRLISLVNLKVNLPMNL